MSDIWPRRPRSWQEAALATYVAHLQQDFLAAVCPGGGKTVFALAVAKYLLQQGKIKKVIVVSPTEALTRQWCDKAAEFGVSLDPDCNVKAPFQHPRQFVGISVTYQAVAVPGAAHALCNALNMYSAFVILDEVHHTGEDKAWGDAVLWAFDLARYRLLLTGTPKRSDTAKIAFATYHVGPDGRQYIHRDYTYGTGRGVRDFVIRRTDCRFYDAEVKEIPYGEEITISRNLSEALRRDDVSDLLRAVMAPDSGWLYVLMQSVHKELMAIRRTVPDAGCLILADNQDKAEAYADIVKRTTGCEATVVISKDDKAKEKLDAFAHTRDPYIIAVRMVSEGVDIPRLRVLVYLTRTKTELFFAQATARVVRISNERDTDPAVIFMPSLPVLQELAQGLEDDVVHEIAALEREHASADADTARPSPPPAESAGTNSTYPATLPEAEPSDFSSIEVGPGGQMSLLPSTISIDNVALQQTLLGTNVHEPYQHYQAQDVIDRYGYPQTFIGPIRQMISDGLVAAPGSQQTTVPPEEPPPAIMADYRVRAHLRNELEALARRIARQHMNDNFTGVRNQINRETGAYAQYGNIDQLKAGNVYAKEWLLRLTGTAR
ncbi:DEAD/DEAH box helicase [Streptomyces chrestomyceticus]|uniref:DEAD/DEAH box helicase n=1 Tax=Streptomyces chrestomyceticus TaxID=68185 RepID=UPI0035A88DEB